MDFFVFVYLDDILISSGTEEEHCKHLPEVFDGLHKAGLAINLPSSKFLASKLEFLGHILKASGIRMSPIHTEAIQDYPAPSSKEEISRFLGKRSTKFFQASKKGSPQLFTICPRLLRSSLIRMLAGPTLELLSTQKDSTRPSRSIQPMIGNYSPVIWLSKSSITFSMVSNFSC